MCWKSEALNPCPHAPSSWKRVLGFPRHPFPLCKWSPGTECHHPLPDFIKQAFWQVSHPLAFSWLQSIFSRMTQGLGAPARCQTWSSELGELSSGHWSTRDLLAPHNINQRELSQWSPSQCYDPAPLNDQQAPVLDTWCRTTSKTGTQPHPLAERLPKIIIRSQTPQNTPLDAVCPPERQDPASSIRTQAPVPSTRKPTQPTEPTLPTGGKHQKQQELRTDSLWKGDPKHSKLSKMRRQRNTLQMKEQGKNPPDQINEEEIGSLPEKEFRVMVVKMSQNLGNRMEKIQETFNKDREELKSKHSDEQHNKWS